jgi:hypothetical protein
MKACNVDLHKAAKWLLHVGQDLTHNLLLDYADAGSKMQQNTVCD